MEFKAIDAHSHIGKDLFGAYGSLQEYLKYASKMNIQEVLIMPVASPILQIKNGLIIPCQRIQKADGEITYLHKRESNHVVDTKKNPYNPYQDVNSLLFDNLQVFNNSQNITKFHSIPLIHVKLDTKEYIESLLSNELIPALKVHGIATYSSPLDIPNRLIQTLQQYNKPLIVHTDYTDTNNTSIDQLLNDNNPSKWIEFGIKHTIKVFITHAARLSEEAVKLAYGYKNIVFGFGPDLLLGKEKQYLYNKTDEVIAWCLEHIPLSQLMFDIDYGWNVYERGQWEHKDWGSLNRLLFLAKQKKISKIDLENILYWNAKIFFNL